MKPGPTLIDTLYRASFRNETVGGWSSNYVWRNAFINARRFVLDSAMSTFLGELGTQAFARPLSAKRRCRMAESLRVSARLPHAVTWIEYDLRACQIRSNELLGRPYDPSETPQREGWLLMQHPSLDTAFIAYLVTHDPALRERPTGWDTWTFPLGLAWTVDEDTVLPWRPLRDIEGSGLSEAATGLFGYQTDRAAYVQSDMLVTPNAPETIASLIREWAGVLRRMWALLACINDLPVTVKDVRASKGFVAKASYKRFLDHKTITLTVPTKLYRKVARDALSLAHRRGGQVRGHWRRDWRNPLSPLCEHDFSADEHRMQCGICKGRKLWITEHVRGDTSRGFVTRDYVVTHEEP